MIDLQVKLFLNRVHKHLCLNIGLQKSNYSLRDVLLIGYI